MSAAQTLASLLAAALLSACAASGPAQDGGATMPANVPFAQAQALERSGGKAFAEGNWAGAESQYRRAIHLYQSLALADPAGRAQLSLARVLAQGRGAAAARQQVDAVLASPAGLSATTLTIAHGRAAGLHLETGKDGLGAADRHLREAEALCAGRCPESSALHALRARWHLAREDLRQTEDSARLAAQAASAPADHANARRLLAEVHLLTGRHREALAEARQALVLDQETGAADRVLADLRLMALAHRQLGDAGEAQRLQAVADQAQEAGRQLRASPGARP